MVAKSVCPKCGITRKSGKTSCCAHGGSWFKNCGGAGNAKLDHTWYEGIKACRVRLQSKTAVGQHLHAAQQKSNRHYVNGTNMVSSKPFITAGTTFTLPSVNTPTPTPTSVTALVIAPANTRGKESIIAPTPKSTRAPINTSILINIPTPTHQSARLQCR